MLELWLMPQLLAVFQHDGAPPHIHNEVTTFLNRQLPERWIGWGGSTSWPPWSPDLTPIDFFLWGFVKDEVNVPPMPITLKNLKDRTRTAITKFISLYCKSLARSRISSRCVQGNKWSTYWTCIGYEKNFLSCSLQWCAFNFCVDITFLPIHVCNRSHHL
jgi:hypothetical protein